MNNNPLMQLIAQLQQSSNPQQMLINIMEQNIQNNPVAANMIQLLKDGNYEEFEKVARNVAKEKGIDYDAEYARFRQRLGL